MPAKNADSSESLRPLRHVRLDSAGQAGQLSQRDASSQAGGAQEGGLRIAYISAGSPELKKAHAIQTLYTARQLAKRHEVMLVYPRTVSTKHTRQLEKEYSRHGVKLKFMRTTSLGPALKSPRLFILDKKIFAKQAAAFAEGWADYVITRDAVVAWVTKPDIFEVHTLEHMLTHGRLSAKHKAIEEAAIRNSKSVAAISQWLFGYCKKLNKRTALVPDAYEPAVFRQTPQAEARAGLGIPKDAKVALYSGLTFREGVEDFVQAAKLLPKVKFYLVGGSDTQVASLKERAAKNVVFTGRVPFEGVPEYLSAADVLVLPYRPSKFNDLFSSPLKLFEYMGMGKPIVATDVGCFKGILTATNAKITKPGTRFIAFGIKQVLSNKAAASRLARNAKKASAKYTYEKRAKALERLLE